MTATFRLDDLDAFQLDLGLGDDAVSSTLVRYWCEAFEDSNPRYWAEDSPVAPPGLMASVSRLPYWPTDPAVDQRGVIGMLGDALALPESIVQTVDFSFDRDLRVGDRVRCLERAVSVSDPKETRIGTGRFVRLERRYLDESDSTIGTALLDFFKYARGDRPRAVAVTETSPTRPSPAERGGLRPPARGNADGLDAGSELGELHWTLNGTRMVQMGYICRDFNPVHHDAAYARANGLSGMFVQWACYLGLIDRFVAHQLGADGRLRRMVFRMRRPLFSGVDLRMRGRVLSVDQNGRELAIELADHDGVTTDVTVWTAA